MATPHRTYNLKDVDMLVTASTVIESAIANKKLLQTKRSVWADPFFDNLVAKIENATQTFLGVDSAKDMREATQAIDVIQKKAITDLAECKIQLTEDFKKDKVRRDELLTQLGFTKYHKDAQKGDQEGLINLLYQFKKSLTQKVRDEIVAKGTDPAILDAIIGYADSLKNADVSQESLKGLRKDITAAGIKEFNDIYDEVISISKIAANFFKDKPTVKEQFSFSKVAKALNAKKKAATPAATPAK